MKLNKKNIIKTLDSYLENKLISLKEVKSIDVEINKLVDGAYPEAKLNKKYKINVTVTGTDSISASGTKPNLIKWLKAAGYNKDDFKDELNEAADKSVNEFMIIIGKMYSKSNGSEADIKRITDEISTKYKNSKAAQTALKKIFG